MSWPLFPLYHRESGGKPSAGGEEEKRTHSKKQQQKKRYDSAQADKTERREAGGCVCGVC